MGINVAPKILVVDDTPANIVAMEALLDGVDAEIITANSGTQALEKVLSNRFALILMDIQMPEMDGYKVAEMLRSKQSTRDIPIIFVTAIHKSEKNQTKAYELGVVDFIEKPINAASLLSKVNVFLGLNKVSEQLRLEEQNTRATLAAIPYPIMVLQKGQQILYVNDAVHYFAQQVAGKSVLASLDALFDFDKSNLLVIKELISAACTRQTNLDAAREFIFYSVKNKKPYTFELRVIPLITSSEQDSKVVLVFNDVTESRQLAKQLAHQAQHDSLTGLPNRRYFDVVYREAVKKQNRSHKLTALCLIDLDNFKAVNDTMGHFAGDNVLKETAKRILSCLRDQDILARFGGDEFCVLIEQADNEDAVLSPVRRIIRALEQPYTIQSESWKLGGSIGVTIIKDGDERNSEEILSDADLAMYQAKSSGRGCYKLFEGHMREQAHKKIAIQLELQKAAKYKEFVLYYQPQIDLMHGAMYGLEALIRWEHPEKGLIPPVNFINELEGSHLMNEVGEWVILEACRQLSEWQNMGLELPCLSVNVSLKQFQKAGFPETVEVALKQYEIQPKYLGIEITETMFMNINSVVHDNIKQLSDMGCKISLDDFGTGYSSLSYLVRFPIDVLKIDQVFVQGLAANQQYKTLVAALINMAKGFGGMTVIAEGVETEEQLCELAELGCDFYQGYLFSKPIPATEITRILKREFNPAAVAVVNQ